MTQPYEVHEDRRQYPRIIVDCPAKIRFDGSDYDARIYDLSPDGLQLRCDRSTLQNIRPSGKSIQRSEALMLGVSFELPVGREYKPVDASVRMFYFVLLPEEKERDVAIGVQFASFRDRGERHVEEFIMDILAPVETRVLQLLDRPLSSAELAQEMGVTAKNIGATLSKLIEEGEVVTIGNGGDRKHVRLRAAVGTLFEKVREIEARLARLEDQAGGSPQ